MKFLFRTSLALLSALVTSVSGQEENQRLFSPAEAQAFKQELRQGEKQKALERLQMASHKAEGESDSLALLRTFMELQSADEWAGHQDALNYLMREQLVEAGQRFPDELSRSQRADGCELVMMGKLYEKYLYDRDEAQASYLKVVKRFMGLKLPSSAADWGRAIRQAEGMEKLNADERYAFKRLTLMQRQKEVAAHRIASALAQKALEARMATMIPPWAPEFDPDDSIPWHELDRPFPPEGGRP